MCYNIKKRTHVLGKEGNEVGAQGRNRGKRICLEFAAFTLISGLISFSYNVVMTVIPLRMADRGLGYDRIGGAMSAVAVGLLAVKLVIGHLSDRLGTKRFILTALLGLSVVSVLLGRADDLASYAVLMAALGIFRGIFLSVNGSFVMDMAEEGGYGKIYGAVQGISSLLASVGGMAAGMLYFWKEGEYALYLSGTLMGASAIWAGYALKKGTQASGERLPVLQIFRSMNRRIFLFCLIVFLQSFVAGPMWSFLIPMYCYNVLLFSPAAVGVLMSLDELVSAPTYMLAGRAVDRFPVIRFNVIFLFLTAAGGMLLMRTTSAASFMAVFLLCSISISCTFVGIPKERAGYIRKEQKGLELALISLCGSLGDTLGSNVLGQIAERFSLSQCMLLFAGVYVFMAGLAALPALDCRMKKHRERAS